MTEINAIKMRVAEKAMELGWKEVYIRFRFGSPDGSGKLIVREAPNGNEKFMISLSSEEVKTWVAQSSATA